MDRELWSETPTRGVSIAEESTTEGPVLFAYDGSTFAKSAIRQAGHQLAAGRPAIALTVITPLETVPFAGPFAAMPSSIAEDMFHRADGIAEEGVRLAEAAGFAARPMVERGSPVWAQIIAVADAEGAGVIVVGSQGHTGLGYVLLGSVATALTHHADQPVLVTRGDGS